MIKLLKRFLNEEYTLLVLLLLLGALATHYLARNLPLDHVPVHSHHTADPDITSKPT